MTEPPETYFELHSQAVAAGDFHARVTAIWGLIARGSGSFPFLAAMLKSSSAEAREDAAGAYGWMAQHEPGVVDELIAAIRSEADLVTRDSMTMALGALKDKRALPVLATLLRDPTTDGDSRTLVVEAIGRIAGRRFDRRPHPERETLDYLANKGH